MASSSGTLTTSSGGSDPVQNWGLDEDLKRLIDQRKRKRMESNRESARRTRMRKQKQLDDLMTELSQLKTVNNKVMANVSITMQHYMNVEAENSVLRAQVTELSYRLESLNQIMDFMNQPEFGGGEIDLIDEFMNNSLTCLYASQPILASADMIQY